MSVLQGRDVLCQMWVQIKYLPEDDYPSATLISSHSGMQHFMMWIIGLK